MCWPVRNVLIKMNGRSKLSACLARVGGWGGGRGGGGVNINIITVSDRKNEEYLVCFPNHNIKQNSNIVEEYNG